MKLIKITFTDSRNFGLDFLRFLAIINVLLNHSSLLLPIKFQSVIWCFADGVLLFFVLSGFLIGRIFIKDFSGDFNYSKIKNFWFRRWFRTLPAYYFTIFLLLVAYGLSSSAINISSFYRTLLFIQNFTFQDAVFFPESWSLSIEEWFYLLLPIICFSVNKIFKIDIKKNVLICAMSVILMSITMRYFTFISNDITHVSVWDNNFRKLVINRFDSIMIGVLLAWIFTYKKNWFDSYKFFLFILGLLIFGADKILIFFDFFNYKTSEYLSIWFFLVNSISVGLMIPFFYYLKKPSSKFIYKIITTGSLISYSMYLVNYTLVSRFLISPLHINYAIKFVLFWMLTVCISILIYKFVELPFMNLRDKKKW